MLFFPSKMSRRMYLLISIIVTIPMLLFSYFYATETKDKLYKSKEMELFEIVAILDSRLPDSFTNLLKKENALDLSIEQKVEVLNRHLQPIVAEISASYPNYRLGYYCPILNQVIEIGHNYNQSLSEENDEVYKSFIRTSQTGKYEVTHIESDKNWQGDSILNIAYPIYNRSEIAGFAWASSKTEDIENEFYHVLLRNIIYTILIWFVLVIIIGFIFKKFSKSLVDLANRIIMNESAQTDEIKSFPELLPVSQAIHAFKQRITHQNNLLKLMIEHIPGAFIAIDNNEKVTLANKGVEKFFHSKDIVGRDLLDFLMSKGVTIQPLILKSLKDGKVYKKEKVYVLNKYLQVDSSPLINPYSGKIVGAVSYFNDITSEENASTEQKKLIEQYFNEYRNLQQLVETIPIAFLAIDNHQRIIAINEKSTTIFQLEKERNQIVGQHVQIIADKLDKKCEELIIYKALHGEHIRNEHYHILDYEMLVNAYPIFNEGNSTVGAIAIYQDITELEFLRNEINNMERLNLVGQMAASITHEIRNPMATIRGFVQLLSERAIEENKTYYKIIIDELDRANGIISDFLSLSQSRVIEMSFYNVNDIIEELQPILMADLHIKGQFLILNLDKKLPSLYLNRKEFKQLILNLTRNATEAMEQGGTLTLETTYKEKQIEFRVSDTGKGIPKDKLGRLFEPFYTTKEKGTGLGLAVTKSIVEKHNGSIIVESNEQGTTFIISFSITS